MGRSEKLYLESNSNHLIVSAILRPSRQEEFEDLVMNFILDQEEKVRQLEEYMCVIGSDFMQLSLEVVGKLRGEIRINQNRTKKIKKITRYPDTKDLKPLNDHKFSKTLTKEGQDSPDGVKRPGYTLIEEDWKFVGKISKPYIKRKAHLLEDKQIPSVGVFDEVFCIWKAFGRNTRDFGSFGEETDKTMDLHQHCSRISPPKLETASQITRDAVTTISKTALQDIKTTSQDLKTADQPFLNLFPLENDKQPSGLAYTTTTTVSADADKFIEELQVEVELRRLNNHMLEEDQTDQEDSDDDAGDQETN
ncbi:hypothetical protein Tco_0321181 [Tanacetum coccineum]